MSTAFRLLYTFLTGLALVSSLDVAIVVQTSTYGKVTATNPQGRICSPTEISSGACLGGLARKATLFQQIVNETNGNAVFIDMGNLLAADGIYRFYRGRLQSEAMRPFRFAAMAPRNLDWSIDDNEPSKFELQSGIPVVSANIISLATGKRAYHPFSLTTLPNGLKVAVVGSNYATALTAGASFARKFTTYNRIGFTGEAIGEAKSAGADIVVVADNSGNLGSVCSADGCFPEFPFMDLHLVNMKSLYGNRTVFSCEDDCSFGRSVLRLDVALGQDRIVTNVKSSVIPIKLSIPPDPPLARILDKAVGDYHKAIAADVIGTSEFTSTFSTLKSDIENFSHSTGDIVADSIMFMARKLGLNPDVVIVNKGAIRDVFPEGNITRDQIQSVVPFSDTISVFNISGVYLLQALQAASKMTLDNAFPEVAGMRFAWSPNLTDGETYGRITDIEIHEESEWRALSVEDSYVVATNGFVRNGGDEYALFPKRGYDFRDGVSTVADAMSQFISFEKVIRKSQYENRRGLINRAPNPKRLTGTCKKGRFLEADGSCSLCPLAMYGSRRLWEAIASHCSNCSLSISIVLYNNGPVSIPWVGTVLDQRQFTLSPSSGTVAPSDFLSLNLTRSEFTATATSIKVEIKPSDSTNSRQCYDVLTLNVGIPLTSVSYQYATILFSIVGVSFFLVTVSICVIAAVVYTYRQSPMIRAASPALLLINLFGALILNLSSLSYTLTLDDKYGDYVCELRWWLTCLGFTLMFSPLLMKIYRIDQIFVSSSMRVVFIPNSFLLRGIGLMTAAMIAFLTIHSIAFPSVREVVPAPALKPPSPDMTYTIAQCTVHEATLAIVLTACGLLTFWGARIAWHSRNVPSDFNESSSIAISLVFVVIYCLLVLPLQFLLHSNPDVQVVLRGVGVNVGVAVSLAAFYLGKLDLICRGRANRVPSIGAGRNASPRIPSLPFSDFGVAIP